MRVIRNSWRIATGLLAIAVLAACATGVRPGNVSVLVSADPIEMRAHQAVAQRLMQAQPGLVIELINVPGAAASRTRLAADFAAGAPADLVLLNYQRIAPFAAKGQLEALGPWLARSQVMSERDFYPQARAPLMFAGQLMCVPLNISSPVIYYNKQLLAATNLRTPQAGWRWDEMSHLAQAVRALRVDNQPVYGFGSEVSISRMLSFVWSNGGDLIDASGVLALASPEATAAMQRYIDLRVLHDVTPDAAADKAEDPQTRFINGRLALYMDSRRAVPTFRDAIGNRFDWDVVAPPQNLVPASLLHAEAICMTAAARNKVAAWAYVEALAGPHGQAEFSGLGRTVPSLQTVAQSPVFLTTGRQPANNQAWLDAIPHLRAAPVHAGWPELEARINAELEGAYYGRQSLRAALDKLAGSGLR